eukprot:CAMPEP_0175452692 /NCGR_PEP_ID=MMETSP0095-20121207/63547_1 /TAXON_ID=311494 /ORGANISM="Alexandrium monilatum, Strain CCMP3105" /LENGTH=53 /DNA_ID=CAMNT_0016753265 /DNA_START=216 /DNA_END=373 /DNA_ORIENTATION=-
MTSIVPTKSPATAVAVPMRAQDHHDALGRTRAGTSPLISMTASEGSDFCAELS